jgi:NADH-quinone oxidoreductase subunit M
LITLAQKELPTMLGFSSIMHMGYLFLGIACWNTLGVSGAVLLMVAHGLSAAMLFGLSGEITQRTGENRFLELGGLAQRAPVLAILFTFASMASMGVPGLANFAGELMVFFASFAAIFPTIGAVFAVLGTVITAIFQLRAIKSIFYGQMAARFAAPRPAPVPAGDAPPYPGMTDTTTAIEAAPYVLLILASLAIGFVPFLLLHIIQPSVALLPFVK